MRLIPPVEVKVVPPTPLVKVFVLLMDPATRDPDTFNDPPVTLNDPVTVVLLNPIVVLLILAVARVTYIVPVIVLPIVISLLVEIVLGFA
jgi:hypothetical protein